MVSISGMENVDFFIVVRAGDCSPSSGRGMRSSFRLTKERFAPNITNVKLTLQLQFLPSTEQADSLLRTMHQFNAAATYAAKVGFDAKRFSQPSIHALCYADLRQKFGLSAQMAVRAIGKAVEVFKRDKTKCPVFRSDGAMTYDERMMSFKGMDRVSLLTLDRRQLIPLIFGEYQSERFDRIKGQCDVVLRNGKWYLYCTIDLPEPPPGKVKKFLGIDLGIVSLVTTSEGKNYTGAQIEHHRKRRARARQQFQRRSTKGAKRRLKKLSGRQRRFQTHTNHVISKQLVAEAKALGVGLALEDLTNIRTRTEKTVRPRQRAKHSNWAFRQLREFVYYKAQQNGVPCVFVDPRNTSRECFQCGHIAKANRKSQAEFACERCYYSAPADFNAAINIAARATVNWLE